MNDQAIAVVSGAIRDRLESAGVGTVYVGPPDDDGAAAADLDLFLYRAVVNADLRNAEHRVAGNSPGAPPTVFDHALPLDLYYLMTVRTKDTAAEPASLGVLGHAMQVLDASPIFTGADFGGDAVRVTFESLSTDEMSRIWALFPTTNYRTSVAYLATPVWIDPAPPAPPPLVIDELYRVGQLEPSSPL